MAKGAEAKAKIVDVIRQAFGDDYIGEFDKKIYVWSEEDGQKVQVAISLTCPKTPIETAGASSEISETRQSDRPQNTELSPEDKAKVEELMKRLNIY